MNTNLTDLLNSPYLPVIIIVLMVLIPATLSAFKVLIRKFKKKYRPDIRNMFLKRHQKWQVDKTEKLKVRKKRAKEQAQVPLTPLSGVLCEFCGVPLRKEGECPRCVKHPLAQVDLVRLACRYDTVAQMNLRRKNDKVMGQISDYLWYTAEQHGLINYETITYIPSLTTQTDETFQLDQALASKLAFRLHKRATALLTWDEANEIWHCKKDLKGKRILVVGGFTASNYPALEIAATALKAAGAKEVAGLFVAKRER